MNQQDAKKFSKRAESLAARAAQEGNLNLAFKLTGRAKRAELLQRKGKGFKQTSRRYSEVE